MWVPLFQHAPQPVGLVGPFITALAVLFGLRRVHRAVFINHRYWFTTWRWGKVAAATVLVGYVMKLSMAT
jgi:hypothetical protein